jgi:hypothetical protein
VEHLVLLSICKFILLSSSGILLQASDNISQPRVAKKTSGGRGSSVARILPLLLIEATYLGASACDIPVEGASDSSKPVDWESVVSAHLNREPVVIANLRLRVTWYVALRWAEGIYSSSPMWSIPFKVSLSQYVGGLIMSVSSNPAC